MAYLWTCMFLPIGSMNWGKIDYARAQYAEQPSKRLNQKNQQYAKANTQIEPTPQWWNLLSIADDCCPLVPRDSSVDHTAICRSWFSDRKTILIEKCDRDTFLSFVLSGS